MYSYPIKGIATKEFFVVKEPQKILDLIGNF